MGSRVFFLVVTVTLQALECLHSRPIPPGNSVQKRAGCLVRHDMEMFESGHAPQARPALKPDYLIPSHAAGPLVTERAGDKVVHLCSRPPSQGAALRCGAVFFLERELGPYDQMRDVFVDPVRPVVVKDLVVARLSERGPARRSDVGPPNALMLDEALYRAVCLA
jgi:hypothetical protein